jgi:GTP diphosphokinase / guanosine-3',5'-bis(diphosphate) 3'-diphosphatase
MNTDHIDKTNLETASNQLWEILVPHLKHLSPEDFKVVELAFITMVDAHGQQRRKSGEFYVIHPTMACIILCDIGLDKDTLAACLLHDVPEDTTTTLKDLSKNFSAEIVFLVEGVTKLSKVRYYGSEEYIENLQRMLMAMSKDLRVILIKLADRLHNLQTLDHVAPEKQRRIALESVEVYAPIAERLGINFMRSEIEDASFPFLYPEEYQKYILESDLEIKARTEELDNVEIKTKEMLKQEEIADYKIKARAKKYYSIYKKIQDKHHDIGDIYDLMALRIIVPKVEDCYSVLSILHRHFTPMDCRLKDYIKLPKQNGYQSIHTTVRDPVTGFVFEFQIRTEEMNTFAEYGIAAHWAYKNKGKDDFLNMANFDWLDNALKLGTEGWSEEEYMRYMKLDLFKDRIFVMTPQNDPIDLPEGATTLDFAFKIHDQIGSKAMMAKINGKTASLDTQLKNGDIVTIITQKNQKPTRDWLAMVKTVNAARHIRQILRKSGEKLPTKQYITDRKGKVKLV